MKKFAFILIALVITALISCSESDSDSSESELPESELDGGYKFDIINEDVLPARSYGSISSSKMLEGFFVTSIKFDKSGNAWIGTFKQGVIKYNDRETLFFDSSNSLFNDDMVINSLAIDSKNNIWIGTNGLIKYDGKEFTLYNSGNTPIPEDYIHSINIDKDDNIWFSSSRNMSGGVVKFDGNNKWVTHAYKDPKKGVEGCIISGIAIAGDNVWAGIHASDYYLMKIPNDGKTNYIGKNQGLEAYSLGDLCADKKNNVYMPLDYSLSSESYNSPHMYVTDGKSIRIITCPYGEIGRINIDSKDNVWCVRLFKSYDLLRYNGIEWVDFKIFPEDYNNAIFCIEEAPDGKIWLGTGKGVYIIDVK